MRWMITKEVASRPSNIWSRWWLYVPLPCLTIWRSYHPIHAESVCYTYTLEYVPPTWCLPKQRGTGMSHVSVKVIDLTDAFLKPGNGATTVVLKPVEASSAWHQLTHYISCPSVSLLYSSHPYNPRSRDAHRNSRFNQTIPLQPSPKNNPNISSIVLRTRQNCTLRSRWYTPNRFTCTSIKEQVGETSITRSDQDC